MTKKDANELNVIDGRIEQILDSGFRYAKYKMCLKRNRRKTDPRSLSYEYLLYRLKEEVDELEQAMIFKGLLGKTVGVNPDASMIEMVAQEAGDVINFASMICDKTEAIIDDE